MPQLPIRTHLIVAIEVGAFLASIVLASFWISEPTGPFEPYFAATALVFLATEAIRRYEGKLFHTEGVERTPAERIRHHDVLRSQFKEEIARCRAEKLRKDVIVRHVNRMDAYPETKERSGISAWFKVGLLDTYHMGIQVGLGWNELIQDELGLRRKDYKIDTAGGLNTMLIGEIPYDFIESMNVDGDEYYYLPHIYCHFAHNGEPYERLYYAEEVHMSNGHSHWRKVASYDEVKRNTQASKR